ncbi:MAG: hypothetical protein K2W96_02755 [Gemmataceae bacterium]|nr:hypothetical protein [Gemmataceae bacterium]
MFRLCALCVAALLLAGLSVAALATPAERSAMAAWFRRAPSLPPPSGPMTAMVKGRVTLAGHDLRHGMVLALAEDGRVINAPVHRGRFFLRAPAGRVRFAVHAPPVLPVQEPGSPSPPLLLKMPGNAGDPRASGLGATLAEGMQEAVLALDAAR